MVAIPTMGNMNTNLVARLLKWKHSLPAYQLHFYFSMNVAPVDRARNQIVDVFLKTKTLDDQPLTHLLMIDSDTVPEDDAIERLLSHHQPVVSGLTPIINFDEKTKQWETFDNCFTEVETDEAGNKKTFIPVRHTGLHKIIRCGGACLLVDRKVFEKVAKPYFLFDYNEDATVHKRSEDIYFCDKVREAGFQLYADSDVTCAHEKKIMI
jgi:GT2 family glycosyltransferase